MTQSNTLHRHVYTTSLARAAPANALRRTLGQLCLGAVLSVPTLLVPAMVVAQTDTTGVAPSTDPLFTKNDAALGAAFVIGTVALFPADRWFARKLQDPTNQSNRFFRHTATNVRLITESSYFIGGSLYAVGRLTGNRRMADLGLHGTEAIVVGTVVTTAGKALFGRARPLLDIDNPRDFKLGRGFTKENYRSFPSGHTLTAFAAAAAVTAETTRWWPKSTPYVGTAMYGGAALTAVSRMYHNKHWASDVMMGAAIGTFAGRKIVQYHHSHPKNKVDRWLLGASITRDGTGGQSVAFTIAPLR